MDKEQKKESLDASRGSLEHELYAAETDLAVAEAGSDEELVKEPKRRVKEIKAKLKAIDDREAKL
jgi:hypothetical protein